MSTAILELEPEATAPDSDAELRSTVERESEFYEVVRGIRVEHAPMGAKEGVLANDLKDRCADAGVARGRGRIVIEVMFTLQREPFTKRRPDFAFVSFERWPADREINPGDAWDVVPDWAVEIVSGTNRAFDLVEKIHEYFDAGVRLVWVVYPNVAEIYVYTSPTEIRVLNRAGELDGGPVLPGLRVPMASLFPREPTRVPGTDE